MGILVSSHPAAVPSRPCETTARLRDQHRLPPPWQVEIAMTSSHGFNRQSLETCDQWEFQDPKMKVLSHISGHILWGYPLT